MADQSSTQNTTWTTRQLLHWTGGFFKKKGLEHPRLCAEMLLAHVLGVERLKLYMDADRPTSELERATFRALVERAAQHEPVDYLVGHTPFFALELKVTPDVLIPRPSTETLVEHVLQHARRTPGLHTPTIADVGTGSGAIAIALAKHLTGAHVIATDQSAAALAIARENAEAQGVAERMEFLEGDFLAPLEGQRVQFLVSNPPYISDDEWVQVPANVKQHEPAEALRGGADGLKYLRPLIQNARTHLEPGGQLVAEFAASQKKQVLDLAEHAEGLTHAHVLADHERLPRVLVADAS